MATVDDRVVAMSFETDKFIAGVGKVLNGIDRLKKGLHFPEAGKGLSGITAAANRTDLSNISRGVDAIRNKFTTMKIVAVAALANIASRALMAGGNIVKSLTLDPVIAGFQNYETQINAVQTILANTGLKGKKGLNQVNGALSELNDYANKTVYNFSEMARNIGTFTAAGVDLKTATGSIKGIANLAALSGSNSQQASTAMYQLSQAIAAGQVHLQDWNSVVNAGMGGKVFQKALADTAQSIGTLKDGSVKLVGPMKQLSINGESFRQALQAKPGQKSWLTSEVLTKTLQHFTGDMTDAQLAAEGFSKSQIKAIQAQAKTAVGAATNIKTLTQMTQALKEEVASAWGAVFKTLFGDINGATKMFTSLHQTIQNALTNPIYAFNKVLQSWVKLGGKKALFNGLRIAMKDLGAVIAPIKAGFRDIFPAATGKSLTEMSKNFENLAKRLKPSKDTIDNLHRTFRGFFAALDIGKQIIGGIFTAFGHMIGAAGKGAGGILNLTGNFGDLITALDLWLKKGDRLHNFFKKLGDILAVPVRLVGNLAGALGDLFNVGGGADLKGVAGSLNDLGSSMDPATKAAHAATKVWHNFLDLLQQVADLLKPTVSAIGDEFSKLDEAVAQTLKDSNWNHVLNVIQTGLIAGIFLTLKKALGGGLSVDLGGGALKKVSSSLDVLKASLVDIQKNIQAHTLLLIATAVGVLSASVVALSLVPAGKLAKSMTAISVGMGQLMAAMALINKAAGKGSFAKLPLIAGSLILLAAAIDALSIAVIVLSKLSWQELAKGLAGVLGLLVSVTAIAEPLSAAGPGMAIASVSMIALGAALTIMAGAVKIFATMKWSELLRGLAGVVLSMDALALASRPLMQAGPSLAIAGVGLILLSTGLAALGGAVKLFASMELGSMAKGIGAIAVALVLIAGAMQLMPVTLPITAAGLILVGIALAGIAGAIKLMGSMNMGTLAKGIGGIALALLALAAGLTAMIASLPGAAALVLAAAGLAVLVPVIVLLGKMKFSTIAKGLGFMIASIVAVGAAGVVAAPGLIALGAALLVLGAGLVLVGASLNIMARALVLMGGKGAKGIGVMIAALTAFIAIIPKVIINFVKGLVEILGEIAKLAPQIEVSLAKIIISMLGVIIKAAPKFADAAIALIGAMLRVIGKMAPQIMAAGWKLLLNLLAGIDNHIVEVTKRVASIVTKFLVTLAGKLPQIIAGGAKMLVALLKGISNNIGKVATAALSIVTKLVSALVNNAGRVLTAGVTIIAKFLSGIARNISKIISAGTNIVVKLVRGIGNAAGSVATAALKTVTRFITVVASQFPKEVDRVATAIIRMMNRLAGVIRQREPEFFGALANIGRAIVDGILPGLTGLGEKILSKIKHEVTSLPGKGAKLVLKALGSAVLPLPAGLGRAFGVKFTSAVLGELQNFEADFQKELAKTGGAANIDFLYNLGNDLATTFKDGLLSGIDRTAIDPIQQAASDIVKQIAGSQADIENTILESNNKIRDANHALDRDYDALRKARKIKDKSDRADKIDSLNKDIKEQKAVRAEALKTLLANEQLLGILAKTSAFILTDPSYQQQIDKLASAKQHVIDLNAELDKQTGILEDLKSKRQSLFDQTFDKFSAMPGIVTEDANGNPIDAATQVQNYITSLSGADDAVGVFTNTLDQLQGMGLNSDTYQQLLDIGPAAQGFADALLALGPGAIAGLNAADSDLKNAATTLADHGASELYDAGIKTAQGLVDGLKVEIPAAIKAAEAIATAIVKAIKKKLRIKSPSQVFAEIGSLTMDGMAQGLKDSTPIAVTAMNKAISDIHAAAMDNLDSSPKITPILDLTQFNEQIDTMPNVIPITAAASFGLASGISVPGTGEDPSQTDQAAPIQFIQNNTSPESLSSIEIYRQTKNQLAQARPVLAK